MRICRNSSLLSWQEHCNCNNPSMNLLQMFWEDRADYGRRAMERNVAPVHAINGVPVSVRVNTGLFGLQESSLTLLNIFRTQC